MTLEPIHLQIAGVAVIVLTGLAFVLWVARAAMGWHRGRPIYMLPAPHPDDHDEDEVDPI